MRLLFVGDLVGKAGRRALQSLLPGLQARLEPHFTVVNVENAAGGFGITPDLAREVLELDVDAMTSGNHIWDRREILDFIGNEPRLLRPANYSSALPGRGAGVFESKSGFPVAVLNLQGRVFLPSIDCPFQTADRLLQELRKRTPLILVDFHAEASSEKMAMGWYLDGKVSALVGTHTHVPTADARVLPKGTAYISDVGMTGSYESVIGMEVEPALRRFLTGVTGRLEPATARPTLCGVLVEVDNDSGGATRIQPVREEMGE